MATTEARRAKEIFIKGTKRSLSLEKIKRRNKMAKSKIKEVVQETLEEKVEELKPDQATPEEIEEFDKETLIRQKDHQPKEQDEEDLTPHVNVKPPR